MTAALLTAAFVCGLVAIALNVVAIVWMLRARRTAAVEPWQDRLDRLADTSDLVPDRAA